MLNEIAAFLKRYDMVKADDHVICAVSGGADSMALLWAMYLLKDKLQIHLSAAHFNHRLRGEESDRDAAFVTQFCQGFGIPLYLGEGEVTAGKKGLEAAAREARYAFLDSLSGKIATAHTADDNAETVLMHLVRGTGLKGLGGIHPVMGNRIRPMLTVTRQQVLAFLDSYHVSFVEDSSNGQDQYLRNRLRHHVMPLLKQENPKLAQNLSETALRLRLDEQTLQSMCGDGAISVTALRGMEPALRYRILSDFLEKCGVREPESRHISILESLAFSDKPSAKANFSGEIVVCRNYDKLEKLDKQQCIPETPLPCPGQVEMPDLGIRIVAQQATQAKRKTDCFTVRPQGQMYIRSRMSGDSITLDGGTKSLKALFVDRKIPAVQRQSIPIICHDAGVLAVYGLGANVKYLTQELPGVEIRFEEIES